MHTQKMLRLCSFLFVTTISWNAVAQNNPSIPDTPAWKKLSQWFAVFATADQDAFARFISEHYSSALLKEDIAIDRADRQARLYLDTRGFKIRSIENSKPREVTVLTQAHLTDLWYRVTMKVDAEPRHVITEYTTQRIQPPAHAQKKLNEQELVQEIKTFMDRMAAVDAFSGTLLIAKDGQPILQFVHGLASKAHNVPIRMDTKLNIASVVKAFTAVSILQLMEQGKLSLTDPIGKHLTDYPNKEVASKVTIHHLLSHSSGMGDYHGEKYICRKGVLRRLSDYIPLFADAPLTFQPGTKMQYSNAGYVLLGLIIEKVSSEDYFDYVRKHIFNPAGMVNTAFYETDMDTPNLATGYTNFYDLGNDYFQFKLGQRRNTSMSIGIIGNAQGGAFSTAQDLLRFSVALRGHQLVNAKSLELMTTSKFFFRKYAAGDIHYGYGLELENVNGERVIGHGGGDLGISSGIRWYPDSNNITVAILSNYDRGGIVGIDKIQEMILFHQK
jgi:CubicO group peptidase (beta-lactamase class C family)